MLLEWNFNGRRRKGKLWEECMDGVRRSMVSNHLSEEDAEDGYFGGARCLWDEEFLLHCTKALS